MNAKHTPGPWEIHSNIGRKGELGVVADAAPCIICVMGNAKAWPVETAANAALIASAPELFEALENALYTIRALDENYDERDSYKQGRTAIAKAYGH